MDKPLVLEADRLIALERIAELEQKILDLAPEIEEALNQSSESWHDNAPFETLRDVRSSYLADIRELKTVLFNATKQVPRKRAGKVSVDMVVELQHSATQKRTKYYLAGDWTLRAGQTYREALVISRKSPLGVAINGKKVGDSVAFNSAKLIILSVQQV